MKQSKKVFTDDHLQKKLQVIETMCGYIFFYCITEIAHYQLVNMYKGCYRSHDLL